MAQQHQLHARFVPEKLSWIDTAANDSLVNVKELGEWFGVHPHTIRDWIRKGKFPAPIRIPGYCTHRWRVGTIRKFIKYNDVQTEQDL